MERIVLKHLSGSKTGQAEEFLLGQHDEIVFGRDPASNVRFAEIDAMVGRRHLKVTHSATKPPQFFVTDLNSRNGTFLNAHPITGTVRLQPGDVLRCGNGGPELRFDYIPDVGSSPQHAVPVPTASFNVATPPKSGPPNYPPGHPLAHLSRQSDASATVPPPRVQPQVQASPAPPAANPPTSVSPPRKTALPRLLGGGALLGAVALVASVLLYRNYLRPTAHDGVKLAAVPASVSPDSTSIAKDSPTPSSDAAAAKQDQPNTAPRIEAVPESKPALIASAAPTPVVKQAVSKPVVRPRPRKLVVVPRAKPKPPPPAPVETIGKKKGKKKQKY